MMPALFALVLAAPQADWTFDAYTGTGRPAGPGADAFQMGPLFGATIGRRLPYRLSVGLDGQLHLLRLTAPGGFDDAEGLGGYLFLDGAWHPLGHAGAVDLELGPVAGLGAWTIKAEFQEVAQRADTRALMLGFHVGAWFRFTGELSGGLAGTVAWSLTSRECTRYEVARICVEPRDGGLDMFAVKLGLRHARW